MYAYSEASFAQPLAFLWCFAFYFIRSLRLHCNLIYFLYHLNVLLLCIRCLRVSFLGVIVTNSLCTIVHVLYFIPCGKTVVVDYGSQHSTSHLGLKVPAFYQIPSCNHRPMISLLFYCSTLGEREPGLAAVNCQGEVQLAMVFLCLALKDFSVFLYFASSEFLCFLCTWVWAGVWRYWLGLTSPIDNR